MLTVCSLIEHLDVLGDYHQFAQATEQFGNDLELAWTETENGANLLWLAAAVGVEPKKIVAIACELLEDVCKQIETVGPETTAVLEAVHAWQKGERSADEVEQAGWNAYSLIAHIDDGPPLPPDANEVADAAVWLTHLVQDMPPQTSPDPVTNNETSWSNSAWMIVNCLAHALAHHQGFNDNMPGEHQQTFDVVMHRFASAIRERITAAEVQAAAQQRDI